MFISKEMDTLALSWPRQCLYAIPLVALLTQVISRIQEEACAVLLVARRWQNQSWFPELVQLLSAALWPMLMMRDLLSKAKGSICYPYPELWILHVWPLDRSCQAFPKVS